MCSAGPSRRKEMMKRTFFLVAVATFLSGIFGVAAVEAVSGATTTNTTTPSSAAVDFRVLVTQYFDAINRGDGAGALAFFSDDAVFTYGAPVCVPSPCVGKAAIQKGLAVEIGAHHRWTITSLEETSNGVGVGRLALQGDAITNCGQKFNRYDFKVQVKDDKITSLEFAIDRLDPETAAFIACFLGPPAASVSLPKAGDAGLLAKPESSNGDTWKAGLAMLALTSPALLLWLRRRGDGTAEGGV
jgi:ketosteroid isomerase-like protein